jgi:hypothetical protein
MAKVKLEEQEPYQVPKPDTIESLKEELSFYRDLDGMVGLFYANNKKANELAKSLNSFVLDIVDGGKSFANYLSLQKEFKSIMETLEWLKSYLKLTEEDIKDEKQRMLPPLEQRALNETNKAHQ